MGTTIYNQEGQSRTVAEYAREKEVTGKKGWKWTKRINKVEKKISQAIKGHENYKERFWQFEVHVPRTGDVRGAPHSKEEITLSPNWLMLTTPSKNPLIASFIQVCCLTNDAMDRLLHHGKAIIVPRTFDKFVECVNI